MRARHLALVVLCLTAIPAVAQKSFTGPAKGTVMVDDAHVTMSRAYGHQRSGTDDAVTVLLADRELPLLDVKQSDERLAAWVDETGATVIELVLVGSNGAVTRCTVRRRGVSRPCTAAEGTALPMRSGVVSGALVLEGANAQAPRFRGSFWTPVLRPVADEPKS